MGNSGMYVLSQLLIRVIKIEARSLETDRRLFNDGFSMVPLLSTMDVFYCFTLYYGLNLQDSLFVKIQQFWQEIF
jgi:hypothetical protein